MTAEEAAGTVLALVVATANQDEAGYAAVVSSLDVEELRTALLVASVALSNPRPIVALAAIQADDGETGVDPTRGTP